MSDDARGILLSHCPIFYTYIYSGFLGKRVSDLW